MRRRMPALLIATLAIVAFVGITLGRAQDDCHSIGCVYLPVVYHLVPTPIPPALSTLVLQQSDLAGPARYITSSSREVTNSEAANSSTDPQAASEAFAQQGRETSWYVQYSQVNTGVLYLVQDRVFRYLTADGAAQGQTYAAAQQRLNRGAVPFTSSFGGFGAPTVQLVNTFADETFTYTQYFISVQIGRYVTEVQVINVTVTAEQAIETAIPAVNRLKATPQ
jgi:hypothetical protein